MEVHEYDVDICIATYKRSEYLGDLLLSLLRQQLPSSLRMRIIVVDNDFERTAEATVEQIAKDAIVPVLYFIEPRKSIPYARNRAISHVTAKYAAFIDDDEFAENNWLHSLVKAAVNLNADVVFGPVLPIYPPQTPKWVLKGKFFERTRYKTGTERRFGGSGNMLIESKYLLERGFRFNPSFISGSDTDLTYRLWLSGARMLWCDEAIAFEKAIPSRMNQTWLLKRAYRRGALYPTIVRPQNAKQYLGQVLKQIGIFGISSLSLPVAFLLGRAIMTRILMLTTRSFGQLTTLLRIPRIDNDENYY